MLRALAIVAGLGLVPRPADAKIPIDDFLRLQTPANLRVDGDRLYFLRKYY